MRETQSDENGENSAINFKIVKKFFLSCANKPLMTALSCIHEIFEMIS